MAQIPLAARRWVERFARAGYATKGAVYLIIGTLAVLAAADAGGRTTGTSGVLHLLVRQPAGHWLLALAAMGLAGYATWRVYCAATDPTHPGRRDWTRAAVRAGYLVSALVHGGLAWQAASLALGEGHAGGGDGGVDRWTGRLLSAPLGPWLVGIVAVGVSGYGLAQVVKGFRGRALKPMDGVGSGLHVRQALEQAARIGLVSRGVVFGIIGWFLARAALRHDPAEAGGLGQALGELARQPYAPVILGGVALGLAVYGAYQIALARWAVVQTS